MHRVSRRHSDDDHCSADPTWLRLTHDERPDHPATAKVVMWLGDVVVLGVLTVVLVVLAGLLVRRFDRQRARV
jgi:hypothetical protein